MLYNSKHTIESRKSNQLNAMRYFIFLTQEGLTKTPDNADIDNLQVLGVVSGESEKLAFENLLKENDYLLNADYDEVVAMELVSEKQYFLNLKNA